MTKNKENDVNKKAQSASKGVHPLQADMELSDLAMTSGTGRFPNFINHGGPVINTPQVYILFVGDWSSTVNQKRAARLSQFTTDLLNSRYMNILSQYGCGTTGTVVKSIFIPSLDHDLSGHDIHNILQTAINSKQIPEPTNPSNTYLLFLDDATAVNDSSSGAVMCEPTSDTAFGYHTSFTTTAGNECAFAVVPSLIDPCLTTACQNGDSSCSLHHAQSQEQRQTQVTSHELAEMFSDPQPESNPAWTDLSPGGRGENGDICNGQSATITVDSRTWTVQRMYSRQHDIDSNGASICIVDPPNPVPMP